MAQHLRAGRTVGHAVTWRTETWISGGFNACAFRNKGIGRCWSLTRASLRVPCLGPVLVVRSAVGEPACGTGGEGAWVPGQEQGRSRVS